MYVETDIQTNLLMASRLASLRTVVEVVWPAAGPASEDIGLLDSLILTPEHKHTFNLTG